MLSYETYLVLDHARTLRETQGTETRNQNLAKASTSDAESPITRNFRLTPNHPEAEVPLAQAGNATLHWFTARSNINHWQNESTARPNRRSEVRAETAAWRERWEWRQKRREKKTPFPAPALIWEFHIARPARRHEPGNNSSRIWHSPGLSPQDLGMSGRVVAPVHVRVNQGTQTTTPLIPSLPP